MCLGTLCLTVSCNCLLGGWHNIGYFGAALMEPIIAPPPRHHEVSQGSAADARSRVVRIMLQGTSCEAVAARDSRRDEQTQR